MDCFQDKSAGHKVTHVALSIKQDLIAYSTVREVLVYNNDWMKLASYKSQSFLTNETVCRLAWRPDGRALAIGYSSGKVLVKNVETHETIAELDLESKIDLLDWAPSYWTQADMDYFTSQRIFQDKTESYIQEVELSKSS
ncbi:hypothetical protein RvY_06565-2 [Ramazzottius varieornatus]|nr:hypothetical protein RvY_06565-2 [Ramazzottius varieornatus]